MKIRSIVAGGALALAVAGGSVAGAGAASAQSRPVPTATGSVALAGPVYHPAAGLQYASFSVFGGRGYYHGWIDYTNFLRPASHTNVWNISKANTLVFTLGGDTYTHSMTVTSITPLSNQSTAFSGYGSYTGTPPQTWTISGAVRGNAVSFTITYNNTSPAYIVTGNGVINPDGSVTGTATAVNPTQSLGFTMPAGSAFQVLSYKAPVTWAYFWDHTALFGYRIPWWAPGAGLPMAVKVHGSVYSHMYSFAMGVLFRPLTQYQITSGYIFVRS
jgi:hypothetical protein